MKKQFCIAIFFSCSIFAVDDTKLKLLAGPKNVTNVLRFVQRLKQNNEAAYSSNLLILGPPCNGKRSLAREIALQSNRSIDEHMVEGRSDFSGFVDMQLKKTDPHVMLLSGLENPGQHVDVAFKKVQSKKNICIIGVAVEECFYEIGSYFTKHVRLSRPNALARKEMLAYYFSQKQMQQDMIDRIVAKTAGINSGRFKQITEYVLEQIDGNQNTDECLKIIDEELGELIVKKTDENKWMVYASISASLIPIGLIAAQVCYECINGDGSKKTTYYLSKAQEIMPYIFNLILFNK